MMGDNRKNSRARKRRRKRKIIFAIEVIVLLILGIALYLVYQWSKVGGGDLNVKDLFISDKAANSETLTGYTNIALFGLDSRSNDLSEPSLSDTIMIASINNDTKEIKIVSVYRDTLLDTSQSEEYTEYRKATEAYSLGGVERSVSMLNKNLDLNITEYVSVNFLAVAKAVDAVGGLDIEITEEEMVHLNNYSIETSEVTGLDYTPLTDYGLVHLNGVQATSYCRIRYTAGSDFKRTERQRLVLSELMAKAKTANISEINKIINDVFPLVSTSLDLTQVIGLASSVLSYELGETAGFPFDNTPVTYNGGDCIAPVTLESNVIQLHQFLFGDEEYIPSSTVSSINADISYLTGYY